MRRFTILKMMGVVLAMGLGMAALKGANEEWAGGLHLATTLASSGQAPEAAAPSTPPAAGRYAMWPSESYVIVMDTATGQAWTHVFYGTGGEGKKWTDLGIPTRAR